jgi:hypothetical protein
VTGGEQHEMEGGWFNTNCGHIATGVDKEAGDLDSSMLVGDQMIATLALPSGRYCQGAWPVNVPAGDAPRTKYFDFGDDYTAVYVAPNTVVGIDADGQLQRSTGGWIPEIGPADNFSKLRSSAKQLYAYYSQVRHVVDIESAHFWNDNDCRLGDLIVSVGRPTLRTDGHYQSVNSFVSQITIRHPQGEGDNRPVPMFHVVTWAGELDPVRPTPFTPTSGLDYFTGNWNIDVDPNATWDGPGYQ